MRVRTRRAPAAGVVSFALVAVANAARDVRPTRRVTCIRIPQSPLEPVPAPIGGLGSPPAPLIEPPEPPLPPFWFEDVIVPPGHDPVAAAAELEAAPDIEPVPSAEAEAVAEPVAESEPAAVAEPVAVPEPAPEPNAEPEPVAAADPEPAAVPEAGTEAIQAAPVEPEAIPASAAPEPDPAPPPDPARPPGDPAAEPVWVAAMPAIGGRETEHLWGWAEPWSFEVPATGAPRRRGSGETSPSSRSRSWWLRPLIAVAMIVSAVVIWTAAPGSRSASARPRVVPRWFTAHPSVFALRTIPISYLNEYLKAAEEYGLDWTKLAAVGQLESDQGRSQVPGVTQGTNSAGAAGPAQFLPGTWARFGVDADQRGAINPYDPDDAITAMAAYLKASGAPQNWRQALFAYNHSTAYVNAVISLSRLYLAPPPARG